MTIMFSVSNGCIAFNLWVSKVLSYLMSMLMFECSVHIEVCEGICDCSIMI